MNIGIYFTPTKKQGGVYQYSITLLDALAKIHKHKYTIITVSNDVPEEIKKNPNFEVIDMVTEIYKKAIRFRDVFSYFVDNIAPGLINFLYRSKMFSMLTPLYRFSQKNYIKVIGEAKLDLIFYPTSSNLSFLCDTPSIVAIHDVMHRVHPQFKEVSSGGRWENREYGFQNISKKAFRILVDSEVGRQDVIRYYKTLPKKVVVLPFLAPLYLDTKITKKSANEICKSLKVPDKYIFYPAKFWPHKNHLNLIKALTILKNQGRKVNLVLTGATDADFSTYDQVVGLIKKCKLEDRVYYLGYIDDKQISALYKNAQAMVMPTFFGPTNIPILEAWVMGTPAITSDIVGCRDQLGGAGLLIKPRNPKDIAKKIWKIYNSEGLRKKLSDKGKKRLEKWTFKDLYTSVDKMIKDFEKENDTRAKNN